MKIGELYNQFIAGKGRIFNSGISSNVMPIRERDPKSIELENDVTLKMQQAIESVQPMQAKKTFIPPNQIRIVSYEDAIKELASIQKNNNP